MTAPGDATSDSGRLLANIMHFGRVLRAAGLPVGPGRVLDAVNAARVVGVSDREDFYWTLHAVFVNRSRHRELFDQAFHVFWRNPRLLERMMSMVLPTFNYPQGASEQALRRRLGEAFARGLTAEDDEEPPATEVELDAALSWSAREVLQDKDFEQMSSDEIARAKSAVARMRLLLARVPIRRYRRHRLADPALSPAPARHPRRHARQPAQRPAVRPWCHSPGAAPPAPAVAAAGDPVRRVRIHEPVFSHVTAFCPHVIRRSRQNYLICLRHPAHQRDPPSARKGRGHRPGTHLGSGLRLERGYPYRQLPR
jgi:hypothetical protein